MPETKTNSSSFHRYIAEINLPKLYASCGLNVLSREGNQALWDETLLKCAYIPAAYTNMNIDFLYELQKGNDIAITELSAIIIWDGQAVALWPLFLSVTKEGLFINCLDNHALPPIVIAKTAPVIEKKVIRGCLQVAGKIAEETGMINWSSMESCKGNMSLSSWHLESMALGAVSSNQYELFVDMSLEMTEIRTHFRKSYKSLINAAERLWTVGMITDATGASAWEEFKILHAKVSGRKTRSDKTWSIHFKDIEKQTSFLICLRNENGDMVGGGFFNTTRDEGLYASGVYDRSLFDKPLGHVVQYRAMEELKKRGIKWYKLGPRPFIAQTPQPSEKEISIGEFKQGFATHVFPRYILTHPVKDTGNNPSPEVN